MTPTEPDEISSILNNARVLLRELAEEGLASFEPLAEGAALQSFDRVPPEVHETQPEVRQPIENKATAEAEASAPRKTLDEVRSELGECTRCPLCEGRNKLVFGEGDPAADILFVGEGPGEQEDQRGIPFCGRAGELLTSMIEKGLQIPRSSVYICNVVKCRPPGNRDPLPKEIAACRPFLEAQIAAIQPKVIVALGKPAASLLLGRNVAITRERGQWRSYGTIPVMPTFHPAYLLRNASEKGKVWADIQAVMKIVGLPLAEGK